ncbi:DUF3025 domain-containing protein [Rhizobacter sp. AJA081-3]|uniref:DUF3025 domain-containing protein n=1 Tax=Rhizobacter sp. AJA081-3 TaxID=2753607 RepID=UPI001ADFFC2D|nr:DUF3025 domain-containing protein [Rhizobacter sp. AJA081-3]QTN24152.1 DUF3025 domain-containing protein [Rhizobacter sp. AJA081-3]
MTRGGEGWRAIDWRAPWLAPYAALAGPVMKRLDRGDSVAEALSLGSGPVRFVPQAELTEDEAYEAFIRRTGRVPTRDNLHDLFNGLVWLRFPALKQRLNELHAAQIAAEGISPARGPLRDALTLFDENGAWWQAPAELVHALQRRDWHALFVTHRALWSQPRLTLVGHALLEKLVQPRTAITAHLWVSSGDVGEPSGITAASWSVKPFLPLPVLGVPTWWPANENPGFYDDAGVFRPARG